MGLGSGVRYRVGWDWGCRHTPPGPVGGQLPSTPRTCPSQPAVLSPSPFVLTTTPAPSRRVGGRVPPPRPHREREVPGPWVLPTRLGLRAERCPEAQPGWQGSCICRKITLCLIYGRSALPREQAPLLSGIFVRKSASSLALVD